MVGKNCGRIEHFGAGTGGVQGKTGIRHKYAKVGFYYEGVPEESGNRVKNSPISSELLFFFLGKMTN